MPFIVIPMLIFLGIILMIMLHDDINVAIVTTICTLILTSLVWWGSAYKNRDKYTTSTVVDLHVSADGKSQYCRSQDGDMIDITAIKGNWYPDMDKVTILKHNLSFGLDLLQVDEYIPFSDNKEN